MAKKLWVLEQMNAHREWVNDEIASLRMAFRAVVKDVDGLRYAIQVWQNQQREVNNTMKGALDDLAKRIGGDQFRPRCGLCGCPKVDHQNMTGKCLHRLDDDHLCDCERYEGLEPVVDLAGQVRRISLKIDMLTQQTDTPISTVAPPSSSWRRKTDQAIIDHNKAYSDLRYELNELKKHVGFTITDDKRAERMDDSKGGFTIADTKLESDPHGAILFTHEMLERAKVKSKGCIVITHEMLEDAIRHGEK